MKTKLCVLAIFTASVLPLAADMTPDQREFEMRRLAANYAKNYAPYEWKRELFNYDMLDITEWVRRARAAESDVEYFEVAAQYVTSLRDTHSSFALPSNFQASLGFHTDIYEGKVMIDNIVRGTLPVSRYPFDIGWELVSIDGVPAEEMVRRIMPFISAATPRTRARRAAQYIASRLQAVLPRAPEIGDTATIVVRSPQGEESSYEIPWTKFFAPLTTVGVVPSPVFADRFSPFLKSPGTPTPDEDVVPLWYRALGDYRNLADPNPTGMVLNYGSLSPIWALPTGFQRRLGATGDAFFSGIYQAEDRRIGLIRIPNFGPSSTATAMRQFETEIAFFQANADGLVIDVMRNNGGDGCYAQELLRRVIPYQFQMMGFEMRASNRLVNTFSNFLEVAKRSGAPDWQIALHQAQLDAMVTANKENRGRTGTLSVCGPTIEQLPAAVVFTKPIVMLIDDFSTSAADVLPAIFQDAARGPLFGYRTNGAGGAVAVFDEGVFSEATPRVTLSLMVRPKAVSVDGYPTTNYIENVGVHPDIPYDFMTVENLRSGRRLFTDAFTRAIVEHINGR